MNSFKVTTRASIVGLAVVSLLATGGTGSDTPVKLTSQQAFLERDSSSGTTSTLEIGYQEVSLTEKSDGSLSFVKNGKTYNFNSSDLIEDDNNLYSKKFDGKEVLLQNSSKRNLEKFHDLVTDDVNLWYFAIEDDKNNVSNRGYAALGTINKVAPDNKTTLYSGRAEGYSVSRHNAAQFWVDGDINLTTDFNIGKQTISGDITNIKTQDQQDNNKVSDFGSNLKLVNGKISNGKFTTELAFADSAVARTVESSSVKGGFYGDKSSQAAGIGTLTTPDNYINFGFTANKK